MNVSAKRRSLCAFAILYAAILCAVAPENAAAESPANQNALYQFDSDVQEQARFVSWTNFERSSNTLALPVGEDEVLVKAYGSFWTNMYYANHRTNPGSYTLWVFSPQERGEASFEIDARRNRIGAEVKLPDFWLADSQWKSQGRFEIDFLGQFLTENSANARLRHAYWEAANDEWRLLFGQTWDVISPLRTGMLNFTVGWAGGNIGFRRAQFRAERCVEYDSDLKWLTQFSLNQDIINDFPTEPGIRREPADFPVIMARSAWTFPGWTEEAQLITLGVSGHVGETGFDFLETGPPPLDLPPENNARFTTWSFNTDAEIPLTDELLFRGEFFHGANLSPFLGGIGQGVCPCLRKSIRSIGGWCELVQHWGDNGENHIGCGIDDPYTQDSLIGRTQNSFIFGNLIWHITPKLLTGWEVTWWKTMYQDTRAGQVPAAELTPTETGEAVTLEWMVRYNF